MEVHRKSVCVSVLCLAILVSCGEGLLIENFYKSSCPNVENIVRDAVTSKVNDSVAAIPAVLRLFFHDCFIEGCDASILISSPKKDAVRDGGDNLSLAEDGFDTVIKAKQAVEAQCPGKVSCADILAIAARDSVFLSGGPAFPVELGRRDGLVSRASDVAGRIPDPKFRLAELNSAFAKNNLSQTDMIALSGGGHTIGYSHCGRFEERIHGKVIDPTLDPVSAQKLLALCPKNVRPEVVVTLDPVTPLKFDNVWFKNLMVGRGLFTSDIVLYTDPASRPTVEEFANSTTRFYDAFIVAMRKLGRVGVKTGVQGEIRRDCTAFN